MFKGSDLFQDLFLAWKQRGFAQGWKIEQNMRKRVVSGVLGDIYMCMYGGGVYIQINFGLWLDLMFLGILSNIKDSMTLPGDP